MDIVKNAVAGTMESSDVYVEIEPNAAGLELELESVVYHQFGESIREVVLDMLKQFDVQDANVFVNDRGALECVIRARMETAIVRGKGE
jgi:citrate lyase subunit gamma (acyl carrier protein)